MGPGKRPSSSSPAAWAWTLKADGRCIEMGEMLGGWVIQNEFAGGTAGVDVELWVWVWLGR